MGLHGQLQGWLYLHLFFAAVTFISLLLSRQREGDTHTDTQTYRLIGSIYEIRR
jgi:hypothetical protein